MAGDIQKCNGVVCGDTTSGPASRACLPFMTRAPCAFDMTRLSMRSAPRPRLIDASVYAPRDMCACTRRARLRPKMLDTIWRVLRDAPDARY